MPDELWSSLTTRQPDLSSTSLALVGLVAVALVGLTPVWRRTRHLVTIAHEGGHAVAAVLTGRRLAGIRLHSDTSGLTVSRGRPTGPGMVLTALAGYPAPALLGLAAAYGVAAGWSVAVLWATVVLLALLLVQVRNVFGLYAVTLAGAGVLAVTWWGSGVQQSFVAHAGAAFLLLGAVRAVAELPGARRSRRARDSDADVLARLTHVPATLWVLVFGAVALASLLAGGLGILGTSGRV